MPPVRRSRAPRRSPTPDWPLIAAGLPPMTVHAVCDRCGTIIPSGVSPLVALVGRGTMTFCSDVCLDSPDLQNVAGTV